MADPWRKAGGSTAVSMDEEEVTGDYDEELDFFSPKFNPAKALHAPNISVPFPEIKCFQSVQSYEDAVKRRQQQVSKIIKPATTVVVGDVGLKQRQDSVRSDKFLPTRSIGQASKADEQWSSEKLFIAAPRKSVVASSSENEKKKHAGTLLLQHRRSEGVQSNISVKSQEMSALASSKSCERVERSASATEGRRHEGTPTSMSRNVKDEKGASGAFKRSLSLSSSNTKTQHHQSSQDHERSASYRHTSSASQGTQFSLQTQTKDEEMSRSCDSDRSSKTGVRSRDRSASALSRNVEKQFHASKGKELPSTSISTLEKRESFNIARKNRESRQISETQGSRSHRSEVQEAHSIEYMESSAENTASPPDDPESSSTSKNRTRKLKTRRNIFSRMESMDGPLRLLTRCAQEHLLVRVMIRGAVSVRGICRGYIVAFDKHFNMAMIDVEEIYRRPAVLGKVKSRRSHKLLAAQKTLQKEREELQAKWREEQEISDASCSFKDLSIKSTVRLNTQQLVSAASQNQEQRLMSEASTSGFSHPECHSFSKSGSSNQPTEKTEMQQMKVSKSCKAKIRQIHSVYEGLKAPLSPFEREALMLGIPDENVDRRHINQMFIRGENIVSVSIIEEV